MIGAASVLATLACLSEPTVAPSGPSASPPDIVLVTVDTLRRDHLGVYGYALPTSPWLDELAARGTVFDRAYAPTGWTAPSMASLFTGVYPAQHGVDVAWIQEGRTYGQPVLSPAHRTLAEGLAEAGYQTFGLSTNGHVTAETGFSQGFEIWEELNFYDHRERHLEAAREWTAARDEGPRFIWFHYMAPHAPYERRDGVDRFEVQDADPQVAAYDSEIAYVDAALSELMEALELSDPIFVFTADHGELLGGPHGWGHGGIEEDVVRVPLVVVGPGVEARRTSVGVSLVDLEPTLLELAGARPGPSSGRSLVPELRGRDGEERHLIVTTRRAYRRDGLVHGTDKVTWNTLRRTASIFDLAADPDEQSPSFDEATVAEWAARFQQLSSVPPPIPALPPHQEELDVEGYERLKALGYVD
jgi:choline-sulfatase